MNISTFNHELFGTVRKIVMDDASVKETDGTPTYEDASHKLKTQAYPNSVIVYAIGIDDNLSKQSDADLKRIVYANSEELFTIEDYTEAKVKRGPETG